MKKCLWSQSRPMMSPISTRQAAAVSSETLWVVSPEAPLIWMSPNAYWQALHIKYTQLLDFIPISTLQSSSLSAEGNPCSVNGKSGATLTLITMKSGLARLQQETWSMSHKTQHELHQIQDWEGRRQGLPSPAYFLLRISSPWFAEHLSLQIPWLVLLSPALLYYHGEEPLWHVCNYQP